MTTNFSKKLGLFAAGIAVSGLASTAQAKEEWIMTTAWPDNLDLIQIDRHWVELVNNIAGDELEIDFRAGGTLMPGYEVFDATQAGSVQASGDWPGYWAGRSSAFSPLATTTSLFNGVDYLNWIQQWGGFDLYQEVYGEFNMVYLPYGITNNESGFRGNTPIENLADLEGKRLRLSGRDQGRVLEKLGGSQVTLAAGEIYQALERGVIDGAELTPPGIDYGLGLSEVTDYWLTPGWHQSASVYGVMINKDAWDALSEETQKQLKIAADATLAWSISWSERESTKGTNKFIEDGTTIHQLPEEDMEKIQDITNEVILQGACENPMHAKIYHSMVSYLEDYATWRDVSVPYNMSRSFDNLPSLEELETCMNQ